MRPALVLVLAALTALAVSPFPQDKAAASCSAPYLRTTEGSVLERGASVRVHGRAFTDGCQDSMSCSVGLGCESCEHDDPPAAPTSDVRLRLVQDGRSWDLGVVDAGAAEDDRLGWTEWSFTVPPGVRRGPATLRADGAAPVRVRVR